MSAGTTGQGASPLPLDLTTQIRQYVARMCADMGSRYCLVVTDSPSTRYHIDARKYPDHLHWQYEMLYLGEDHTGLWLHLPSGTLARRGHAPEQAIAPGFVALIPANDPWIVEFTPHHTTHLIYVNIGTVPVVSGVTVHQIDLDLDVVLTHEGEIVVLDEDEFVEHQERYGYPEEIIELAQTATREALIRLERRLSPFDGVADRWLARVDAPPLM